VLRAEGKRERERSVLARSRRGPARWPGGCDGEGTKQRSEPRTKAEHAMMIAFVMAIVGITVLGTLNLVAAR
jgi:hypothetical protein